MAQLDELLTHLKHSGGSDLHLATGIQPRMRCHGTLSPIESWPVLSEEMLLSMLRELCEPQQWAEYEQTHDLDLAHGLEGIARFRGNLFRQGNGAAAVFRIIPEKIISADQLGLPKAITQLAHVREGLVLVTGPTGSGKSTTLASVVDLVNRTYRRHIVTIEDPVEFVHQNNQAVLSHREIGVHTLGFAQALRSAIRQDADVVLVGELRDHETISMALTAATMGTLVLGTLHTNSAAKTIDRLIDAFPAEEQPQARANLADAVAGIVSQLLLPTADGKGRCAINEILLRTPGLPNIIREGKTPMLSSVIQSGRAMGMQTMDDALLAAVKAGRITAQEALRKALDRARFEPLIRGE